MPVRHPARCKQNKPNCVTSQVSSLVGCCSIACHSTWQTMRRQAPAPSGAQMPIYLPLLQSNHITFFNPRIFDQTALSSLTATKSILDFLVKPNHASVPRSNQTWWVHAFKRDSKMHLDMSCIESLILFRFVFDRQLHILNLLSHLHLCIDSSTPNTFDPV
jgi:hypothetical protein